MARPESILVRADQFITVVGGSILADVC